MTLETSLTVKVGCGLHDQAMQIGLQSLLQVLRPLFSSNNFPSQISYVITGKIIISLALLPDLMSTHRVPCRSYLSRGFFRKNVLNWQQFVKQMELLLSL